MIEFEVPEWVFGVVLGGLSGFAMFNLARVRVSRSRAGAVAVVTVLGVLLLPLIPGRLQHLASAVWPFLLWIVGFRDAGRPRTGLG